MHRILLHVLVVTSLVADVAYAYDCSTANDVARTPASGITRRAISQLTDVPGLVWSYSGVPVGYSIGECLLVNSGQTGWWDNYLCSHIPDFFSGWSFNTASSLSTTTYSVRIYEPLQAVTSDDYLYIPTSTIWGFTFSYSGMPPGMIASDCVLMEEPSTPSWTDNYLCSYPLSGSTYRSNLGPVAIGFASVGNIMYSFYLASNLVYYYESDLDAGTIGDPKIVPFVTASYAYMATALDPTDTTWDGIKKLVFSDTFSPYIAYAYSITLNGDGTFSLPIVLPVNVAYPFSAALYMGQLILIYTTGTTLALRRESTNWTEVSESATATGMPSCLFAYSGIPPRGYLECSYVGVSGKPSIDYMYISCDCGGWLGNKAILSNSPSITTVRNTRSYSRGIGTFVSGSNLMVLSSDASGYVGPGATVSVCSVGSGILSYNIMRKPNVPRFRDIYVADVLRTDAVLRCDLEVLSGSTYTCDCSIVEHSSAMGPYFIYTSDPQPYFCDNPCEWKICWSSDTAPNGTVDNKFFKDNNTHVDLGLNSQYDSLANLKQVIDTALGGIYQGHIITGDLVHEETYDGMNTWWNNQFPRLQRDFEPVYLLKGNHDGASQAGYVGAIQLTEWALYMEDFKHGHIIQAYDVDSFWLPFLVRMVDWVEGSTSYSFQSGKYLIINLHDTPIEAMDMDDNGRQSYDSDSRWRQAFYSYLHRVYNSVGWLKTELKFAKDNHLRVIVNMHQSGYAPAAVTDKYTLADVNGIFQEHNSIIAAIFIGHIHGNHGQVEDQSYYPGLKVPFIYVGSRTHHSYTIVRLGDDEIETIPFYNDWNAKWSLRQPCSSTCCDGPCSANIGRFGTYKLEAV